MSFPIRKCDNCGMYVYRGYPMNDTNDYKCDIQNVPHVWADMDETKTDDETTRMIRASNRASDP